MSDEKHLPAPEAAEADAPLDPRRNAFRADLAAEYLYGKVNAPRYVPGVEKQVARRPAMRINVAHASHPRFLAFIRKALKA